MLENSPSIQLSYVCVFRQVTTQQMCYNVPCDSCGLCEHADDQLVSGSCDGSVRVWCMDSLKCVHTLESHTADVNSLVAKVSTRWHTIVLCV